MSKIPYGFAGPRPLNHWQDRAGILIPCLL